MPSAVIIGAGPGIGLSVARRFAREGFDIGLIARTRAALDPDEIAEEYWLLHAEPRGHWRREVSYQGGARAAGADTADEIREADAPFFRALLNRDVAALEDLLAEDFVIVEVGTGAVHPRADF